MAWKQLRWVMQWGRPDVAVWVSVKKLDSSWRHDVTHYIGPDCRIADKGSGSSYKYRKFGEWVARRKQVQMPHVNLDPDGIVAFTNGRHRFAWLRDHGMLSLQISTNRDQVMEIKRRFGTRSRLSRFRC
jgi:hypothetical protein